MQLKTQDKNSINIKLLEIFFIGIALQNFKQ